MEYINELIKYQLGIEKSRLNRGLAELKNLEDEIQKLTKKISEGQDLIKELEGFIEENKPYLVA